MLPESPEEEWRTIQNRHFYAPGSEEKCFRTRSCLHDLRNLPKKQRFRDQNPSQKSPATRRETSALYCCVVGCVGGNLRLAKVAASISEISYCFCGSWVAAHFLISFFFDSEEVEVGEPAGTAPLTGYDIFCSVLKLVSVVVSFNVLCFGGVCHHFEFCDLRWWSRAMSRKQGFVTREEWPWELEQGVSLLFWSLLLCSFFYCVFQKACTTVE